MTDETAEDTRNPRLRDVDFALPPEVAELGSAISQLHHTTGVRVTDIQIDSEAWPPEFTLSGHIASDSIHD